MYLDILNKIKVGLANILKPYRRLSAKSKFKVFKLCYYQLKSKYEFLSHRSLSVVVCVDTL